MATSSSKKRRCLSLSERVDVIRKFEKGESARSIADRIGVGKTQIQSIIKDKEKIVDVFKAGTSSQLRRLS